MVFCIALCVRLHAVHRCVNHSLPNTTSLFGTSGEPEPQSQSYACEHWNSLVAELWQGSCLAARAFVVVLINPQTTTVAS